MIDGIVIRRVQCADGVDYYAYGAEQAYLFKEYVYQRWGGYVYYDKIAEALIIHPPGDVLNEICAIVRRCGTRAYLKADHLIDLHTGRPVEE